MGSHIRPTPAEALWSDVHEWFGEEDGGSHAGPDITFDGLDSADVERVWQFLRAAADPIDTAHTTWDAVDNVEVGILTALEHGTAAAAARCPNLLVGLTGITVRGAKLPWLGVFIYTDGVGLYWWVSDDSGWNPETVAALAKLIDELRQLAPAARVCVEGDEEGTAFLPSIDRFLSASARVGG
jgi:hypothetical protein